jgi:hypothetical protein
MFMMKDAAGRFGKWFWPIASLLVLACTPSTEPGMQLASSDMRSGAPLAKEFYYSRCGGQNVSPELHWIAPRGAQSYALTLIDTGVRPRQWSHWIVLDIPGRVHGLARGAALPAGARAAVSNFGDVVYAGPCPPAGSGIHHYDFTIYAFQGTTPRVVDDGDAEQTAAALRAASMASATISVTAVTDTEASTTRTATQ